MPATKKPLRKKEIDAIEAPIKKRICELCGHNYQLGKRELNKKMCERCHRDKESVSGKNGYARLRLEKKGFTGTLSQQMSDYEASVEAGANELLAAYVDTMKAFGSTSNETLLTLNPPELIILEHEATNEFTPYLKQIFLNLYVKMPRQVLLILEHLGISEHRYQMDMNKYDTFRDAIKYCDRKHVELLEIVSYHNALNPKATSERIFLMKAGDPARYRESYKGDTFNLGQMNITVSSNIPSLGIPKNKISGGGKAK